MLPTAQPKISRSELIVRAPKKCAGSITSLRKKLGTVQEPLITSLTIQVHRMNIGNTVTEVTYLVFQLPGTDSCTWPSLSSESNLRLFRFFHQSEHDILAVDFVLLKALATVFFLFI